MNANELADELSKWYEDYDGRFDLIEEAATMLRQQQAEIEHLKELFGCDPAYFEPDTHPVKELTDEEIGIIADEVYGEFNWSKRALDFAKAILRKAQEK